MTFQLRRYTTAPRPCTPRITTKAILLSIALLGGYCAQHAEAAPWSLSVVDDKGQPVAARVRVSPGMSGDTQFLETDAGGRLTGDSGTDQSGAFAQVFIYAPGHAPAGGLLRIGENRARLGVPRTLTGRVYDDGGKPLAGVAVELTDVRIERIGGGKYTLENSVEFYPLERERDLFTGYTDATGRYKIPNLPRSGTATIAVRDPLWQNVSVQADLLTEAETPALKTQSAARLSGRILAEDGTPVKDMGITALAVKTYASTNTDAEGRYLLGGLPAGEVKVHVGTNPQSDSGVAPPTEVVAVIGKETKLPDIHLAPGALVEIKTVPPLPGSYFALRSKAAPNSEGEYYLPTDSGVLRARILPGSYLLKLIESPKGWNSPTQWPTEGLKIEAIDRQTTPVEIRLEPALTLSGIARDEKGQPLSGVRFGIRGPYDYGEALNETAGDPAAVSDEAGRFLLQDLKPGENALKTVEGWEIVKPATITLPTTRPLVVTLKKITLAPLQGRVVDDRGRAIENALVSIEWLLPPDKNGMMSNRHLRARTDAEGRYHVNGVRADSQVILKATKPGHRFVGGGELPTERTIQAIDGTRIPNPNAEFSAADLVLQPLLREASGRVLDADGKPIPNALVAALGGGQDKPGAAPRNIARTDALGHFKLYDLPAGELGFVAGAGDGFAQLHSSGTTLPDMVLQRQAPVVENWELARRIVMELVAATDDSYYARRALPYTLGPYDYHAALEAYNALQPANRDNPQTRRTLMSQWISSNPQTARLALPAMLPALEEKQDLWFSSFVTDVAQLLETPEREAVPGETAETATLRAWVWRHYAQLREKLLPLRLEQYSDLEMAYQVGHFAKLSALLGQPDAAQWARSAVQIAARRDAVQENGHYDGVPAVFTGLAEGGTTLVLSALEAAPPAQRAFALSDAIPDLARTDMAGARKLLELIPQQTKPEKSNISNADPEWAFGLAAKAVLRRMTAADADEALALARRVTTEYHRAEALALAARLQPDGEALFREAFEMANSDVTDRGQMMVVALALASDVKVGNELLAKLEDRFFEPQRWNGLEGPSVAAFYLAQTQPGRARAHLEWKWAQAQNTIGGLNGPQELESIAMAMSAASTERALEMADSIPPRTKPGGSQDQNQRWETKRKIAQYLLAPENIRRTLNFSRWTAGDTWTPGDDTGW